MSVYSLGIPFKITCGGDAASQFYNLLQERNAGDKRAVFYGESAVNAARNFLVEIQFYTIIINFNFHFN